ncbi:putative RNA-directed DNA polymerase [Tanacetum coccineum]
MTRQSGNNNKRFNANSEVNQFVPGTSGSISSSFINEQMMKLLSLINEKPTPAANMIIDSGANQHMTDSTKDMFNVVDVSSLMLTVGHPNGTLAKIFAIGSLRLTSSVVLFDVLVVLNLCKLVRTGSESGGLYLFDLDKIGKFAKCNSVFVCHVCSELWHCRLGHPADQVLSILGKKLGFSKKGHMSPCDICHKAKQTREPFPLSDHKSKSVSDIIHCDVWGPYRVVSKDGFKYFLTIVDDFSRAVWVYLLKSKTKVGEYIENFIKLIFTQFGKKIKIVRSDNGTKFVNNHLSKMFSDLGIVYQTSCAYTSDDCFTIEDEVASVATQIKDNVTSEGNIQMKQNGEGESNTIGTSPELRRSTRQRVMPARFDDFVVDSSVRYGLEKYVCYNKLSRSNLCFSTTLNKSTEPKTFQEASQNPKWIEAMYLEMEAMLRNNTYILADFPPGRKAIGYKWIWKIKYKSSGEIDRYKARLVAKGFGQREGIDYEETFSPVVKMVTEDVYMELPPSNNDIFIAILVYVDDIVVTGIEVLENKNGMCLSQRKYCLELLSEYGLLACKPDATPLQQNVVLGYEESQSDKFLSNMSEYQKIVGKLIYLSITRPDISYDVHCLSQHMHAPLQSHFNAALRVLRYLKNASGTGVQFDKGNSFSLHAFLDADYAKCPKTRKSVSDFCWYLCNNLVSWKSKKQATISRSSAESEYRCLASTICEVIWVIKILKDLGVKGLLPAHLYYDSSSANCKNQATISRSSAESEYRCLASTTCKVIWVIKILKYLGVEGLLPAHLYYNSSFTISISGNPVFHEKIKHFEIDLHLVREKVGNGVVKVLKVASANNVADIFTKGLSIAQHNEFCKKLKLVDMFKP